MYAGKNWSKAIKHAQANANTFKVSYRVFFDTNGNIQIERAEIGTEHVANGWDEIVYPVEQEQAKTNS